MFFEKLWVSGKYFLSTPEKFSKYLTNPLQNWDSKNQNVNSIIQKQGFFVLFFCQSSVSLVAFIITSSHYDRKFPFPIISYDITWLLFH